MVDKAIPTITAGTKPDGTEEVHVVQGVNSRRLTTQQITDIGASIITDATTARILAIGDAGRWIRFTNAGSITCTINTGIFSANDEIMFEQVGTGAITYTAGGGFTLRSNGGLIISNGQNSVQGMKFISGTDAILFGNLV